jgi:metal-responsive CopG/Arc/MetJ family transcriptional regulator
MLFELDNGGMSENEKAVPLAISLPESLIAELDRVAEEVKDSRSGTMRRAIREGLPVVKIGGKADAIALDSALSAEVDTACGEIGLSRNKILLEAIRTGFQAFVTLKASEKASLALLKDPKDKELILRGVKNSYHLYDDPMAITCRQLIDERAEAVTRLEDILQNVPEARERHELVNRLTEVRRGPEGIGGPPLWRCGLSNAEMKWQLVMAEKYGPHPSSWPEGLKKAHNAAEEAKKAKAAKIRRH